MAASVDILSRRRLAAARLTQREALCLSLWCWEGLSLQRIGAELGVNKTTAHRRVQAGRRKLRKAGLRLRRLRIYPVTDTMDPARLDQLGPEDVRVRW